MQARFWKLWNTGTRNSLSLPFYVKCGAILLLFSLSVLVVACSSSTGNATALTVQNPPVTVTINLNNNSSPTPPLAPYWCSAWATNTTPIYNGSTTVGVYAKFIHNVNMNPVGVGGATATATITWPDNTTSTPPSVTTTDDGLAVFSISTVGKMVAVNKFTYVTVTFHKDGIPNDCTVSPDRAAFFVLVISSPTATTATPSVSPIPSPGTTPIVSPTPTCTPFPFPFPTPKPGKKPTPIPTRPPGC